MTNPDVNQPTQLIHREIKSFVLRQGKITAGQQRALEELLPQWAIPFQASILDLNQAFGRPNPKIIEIGCGMGHATWQIAKNNPAQDYVGIEVHLPGIGSLLLQAREHQVHNLRVIRYDAVTVLKQMIADHSLAGIHIYFPDPWPKKRHHKRRLIQPEFVALLCQKLQVGGYIHLATDWQNYAEWMLAVLSANPNLHNQSPTQTFVARPEWRPLTKFEQRGLKLGHGVWDLIFCKNDVIGTRSM